MNSLGSVANHLERITDLLKKSGYQVKVEESAFNQKMRLATVGALGTLTLVMMARTTLQRRRQGLAHFQPIGAAAFGVSLAAILRLGAPLMDGEFTLFLLWSSAVAWSVAFGQLLRRIWIIY